MDPESSIDAIVCSGHRFIDAVESFELTDRPADVGLAFVSALQRLRARFDAVLCATSAQAVAAEVASVGDHRSVGEAVSSVTGGDPRVIAADERLGAWVQPFEVFAAGFGEGRLSRAHVQALRRVDNKATRPHLLEAQDYLLKAATACEWKEFLSVLRYFEIAFDPDGREPRDQGTDNRCQIDKHADGTVAGRFVLDPIAGQAVSTAIEQEEARLLKADDDADVVRLPSHRRAEAVVNSIARGAARPDGTIPSPLVHLVMGEALLEHLIVTTPAEPQPELATVPETAKVGGIPVDPFSPDWRCELIDGTPLHPHLALETATVAALRRLVLGPKSEVLDLGRRVRVFPAHLRQALLVAARGRCTTPGCSSGYRWLQADHINPWNNNGPTAVRNGQILCQAHNHHKRDKRPPDRPPDLHLPDEQPPPATGTGL